MKKKSKLDKKETKGLHLDRVSQTLEELVGLTLADVIEQTTAPSQTLAAAAELRNIIKISEYLERIKGQQTVH